MYLGALDQSAGNMEGKECRIGVGESAAWTALTSATSNGSANASIEAMTPIGTLVPLALIGLGEVVGGGVGTGLVGLLGFAVLAVFVASLMIGRSPEYLGKKLGPAEMRMAVVIVVAPALAILLAASVLVMSPASAAAVGTPAPFGFTELLYAATSAGGNNGSGLSGLSSNTPLINVVLGVEMLFARLAPLAGARREFGAAQGSGDGSGRAFHLRRFVRRAAVGHHRAHRRALPSSGFCAGTSGRAVHGCVLGKVRGL